MNEIPADRGTLSQAFWRGFSEAGLKPAAILAHARLPATLHLNPRTLLSTAQIFSIFKAADVLACESNLGVKIVRARDRSGHPPAFLAACYAASFRDALRRVERFKRLSARQKLIFSERGGEFVLSKECALRHGA